jgi:hypothetical protein
MQKQSDYNLDQLFENYVIGRPYLGDNILVTEADILRCIDNSINNPYDLVREGLCQGIDWGNTSWGVVGMKHADNPEKTIILDIWNVLDNEAIEINGRKDNPHIRRAGEKMQQWDIRRGVIDAGYGKDRNFDLVQDFPGKVFSCFYPTLTTASTKQVDDIWNEDEGKVSVDRTMTLMIMCKKFRDGKYIIPAWVAKNPLFAIFVKHVTNLVLIRDIEEDEKTHKEVITQRIGCLPGGDHFGHAMNYLEIALRRQTNSGKSEFFM